MRAQELGEKLEGDGAYNEDQFEIIRNEYDNCIHEFVGPKGFQRVEPQRPPRPYKDYKFKLDKF